MRSNRQKEEDKRRFEKARKKEGQAEGREKLRRPGDGERRRERGGKDEKSGEMRGGIAVVIDE